MGSNKFMGASLCNCPEMREVISIAKKIYEIQTLPDGFTLQCPKCHIRFKLKRRVDEEEESIIEKALRGELGKDLQNSAAEGLKKYWRFIS